LTFVWPWALLTLLVFPLLAAAWWLTRRRRKRAAVRVTSIALVRSAAGGRSRWRRRIPAAILMLGLAVLTVGAARPQVSLPQTTSSATIMLAIDVSGSMCSTDVQPNRITAAERSAGAFIKSQAGGPRIGLVAFAGTAAELVPPTKDTQQLLTALDSLSVDGGTAIGEGILTSLDAIAEVDPEVAPTGATASRAAGAGYADDVIVILTDGSNNRGVEPPVAARQAAQRGVRVYTIGYGTGQFGSFRSFYGNGGSTSSLGADYGALRQISQATGGTFYRAQDASQLSSALAKLPAAFSVVTTRIDIAAGFATLGGLLIAIAVALSLWQDRPRGAVARPRATPG
jgi:Ca-activated chloride channel family protein